MPARKSGMNTEDVLQALMSCYLNYKLSISMTSLLSNRNSSESDKYIKLYSWEHILAYLWGMDVGIYLDALMGMIRQMIAIKNSIQCCDVY